MKKILSYILTVCFVCSGLSVISAETNENVNSEAIETVTEIGIMEKEADGTFASDDNLTRAEFAKIIANIYNYDSDDGKISEWKSSFFEGVFEETDFIPPEVMNQEEFVLFEDVYSNNEAYDEIALVSQMGIMVGTGNNYFEPDGNVTVEQALKVILTMMGYGYQANLVGGFPMGFRQVASQNGMIKGISDLSGYASKGDIAKLVYNAFDVPLMQLVTDSKGNMSYKSVKDETFLTRLLNMDYDIGRMTDNGYTNLSESIDSNGDYVIINNVKYTVNEKNNYVIDFIGRDVKVYYSLEDGEDDVIYARLTERDKIVTFDISTFEEITETGIRYITEDTEKDKLIRLKSAPFIIKNGSALSNYTDADFDFNYGTISVVTPAKESEADLIILKSMQNFNIDYVDTISNTIYSTSSVMGNSLDIDDENKIVRVYTSSGELKDISILANGMTTSISYGERIVEIHISDSEVKGFKVLSIGKNDRDEYVITGESEKFEISKDYMAANGAVPSTGNSYDLKLDILGKVIFMKSASADFVIAFMNNVKQYDDDETGENVVRVTYYDLITKRLEQVFPAEKVKITGTDDVKKTYNAKKYPDSVYNILSEYINVKTGDNVERRGALFRFKKNDDGELTEIELAGTQENSGDNSSRLVEIKLSETASNRGMFNGSTTIGGRIIVTNGTQFLRCNYKAESFDTDMGYSITDRKNYKEGKSYDFRAYATTKNSPVAEYIIDTADPSNVISTETPQTCGIVTKIYEALNVDDEPSKFIVLGNDEYEMEDGVLESGNVTNMQGAYSYRDGNGSIHSFAVEEGDIIRYGISADGKIDQVQLVYDANSDYSDGITIGDVVYKGWSEKGNLAGCIDRFEKDVYSFSNPFSANSDNSGNVFAADPYTWTYYNGYMRVMLGSVVRAGDGYVVTTTRNMKENPGTILPDGDGVFATNTWSRTNFTLVTVGKKNIQIQTKPVTELKTYEVSGNSCDRIFITSRLGTVYNMIVYRYEN